MYSERFKVPVFVLIILKRDDKILLIKRAKTVSSGGLHGLPGGGVEANETIISAIIREAHEEVGIVIDSKELRFAHVMQVKNKDGLQWVDFFFEATQWQGELQCMEPDKCDGIAWFDNNQLPGSLLPWHAQALHMISNTILYSEYGHYAGENKIK